MYLYDVKKAVEEARQTQYAVDEQTATMASLIKGRLRTLPDNYQTRELLAALKRELSQYNARSGTWKT